MSRSNEELRNAIRNSKEDKSNYPVIDIRELSRKLQNFHSIFYKIWELGAPIFTKEISTAAVTFNKEGACIEFIFNPDFWNSLNEYSRLFVICHECLHVIRNHGVRASTNSGDKTNIALDISVNESLIYAFDFDKDKLNIPTNAAWLSMMPPKFQKQFESFEYYYNHLPDDLQYEQLDEHVGLSQDEGNLLVEIIVNVIENNEQLKEDYDKCKDEQYAGKLGGEDYFPIIKPRIKFKRKWETLIYKWCVDQISEKDVDQFAFRNRRYASIKTYAKIPTEYAQDHYNKERIEMWLFLDVSGSCLGLSERFFKAAASINPAKFLVKLFCFDTSVHPVSLSSKKVPMGGGTSFNIIEEECQKYVNAGNPYPQSVFVITDGYGDRVNPAKPERWFWLLTSGYIGYIPKDSNVYNLEDFE